MGNLASDSDIQKARIIVQRLNHDVDSAIALNAMHNRAAYEDDISQKFNRTYEAWGLNEVIWSLNFTLIVTLVRMYDPAGRNTASIPALFALTDKENFFESFQALLKQEKLSGSRNYEGPSDSAALEFVRKSREEIAEIYSVQRTEAARELIDRIKASFASAVDADFQSHLRSLRNMAYAHNSIDMSDIKRPKNHYAEDLLNLTIPIVQDINSAISGGASDYAEHVSVWSKRADDFWVACNPQIKKT